MKLPSTWGFSMGDCPDILAFADAVSPLSSSDRYLTYGAKTMTETKWGNAFFCSAYWTNLSTKDGHRKGSPTYGIAFKKYLQSSNSRSFRLLCCNGYHSFQNPLNQNNGFGTTPKHSSINESVTKYFDFVVVGSGVAGLRYALEVSKYGCVAIITKAEPYECNTNYAQGGVSAVLCPSDSVENHIHDTIVAGAYLCDEETVKVVCTEGPDRIKELIAMGASFDHGEDGQLHLAREGGHSHHRIVHAADMTGREIERALLNAVVDDPNITMFEHHFAIDLLTSQDYAEIYCHGVDTLNIETHQVVRFIGKVTLLASGGAGHIYPSTTNPLFHPTALADEGLPNKPSKKRENAFLISEAVRGDGAILYNQSMQRFMPLYDERAELAPRDVVARSIDDQLKKRGEKYVLLDISHRPRDQVLAHFPNIVAECLRCRLDITCMPIPVVPAAHYMCGGVRAGLHGETNIKGLYVAGEVACTGLHGANRLASNSLLEALVFARRAVQPSVEHMLHCNSNHPNIWALPVLPLSMKDQIVEDIDLRTRKVRQGLQSIMWEYVGIVRSTGRLKNAEWKIGDLEAEWEEFLFCRGWKPMMINPEACEMRNLFCCAKLVVSSALARRESRGLHFTEDYPYVEESKRKPTFIFPASPVKLTWSSQQAKYEPWESLLDGHVPDGYAIAVDAAQKAVLNYNSNNEEAPPLNFEAVLIAKRRTVEGTPQFYLYIRATDKVQGTTVAIKLCIAMSNPPKIFAAQPLKKWEN
ncbi:Succinate dehydrogenase [ubiquinone] flavoprotein subunit 1, mitochondrial [Apostasia shenzhenica]|uniref:L-aspartate oxidase n=1 Tax=Apostasia shenzhenica TaxID=1088818 RepID=A0A2I0B7U4_9ASPA|nr:Succinate dehydrogenase [ubiquinone] flavoprotein subunit 1, mitochondrial [Apostasia shenzhenica]